MAFSRRIILIHFCYGLGLFVACRDDGSRPTLANMFTFNDLLSNTIDVQGFSHQSREKLEACHAALPHKPMWVKTHTCCIYTISNHHRHHHRHRQRQRQRHTATMMTKMTLLSSQRESQMLCYHILLALSLSGDQPGLSDHDQMWLNSVHVCAFVCVCFVKLLQPQLDVRMLLLQHNAR